MVKEQKMQPIVTIITVTKDLITNGREAFFRQCVESVRVQDYPNIEHIIIDGESTDGSIGLFEELGLLYFSQADTGVYQAFNRGIERASGEYIAFLNSDDFYSVSDAVSLVVEALEKNQADFSCAPFDTVDFEGEFCANIDVRWENLFIAQPFGHPTMFAKKELFLSLNGFDESYTITGDFDLIFRAILQNKKPVVVPSSFVKWRIGGISNTSMSLLHAENTKVIQHNCGLTEEEAIRIYQRKYMPKKILERLLAQTSTLPEKDRIMKSNRKRFFKFIRRQMITLHISKGKRCFKLLGISIYKEGSII